jgi:hypothetical protein
LAERRADWATGPTKSPEEIAEATAWAEAALASDPLNARALRILGQLALASGDAGKASAYLESAVRHSIHESAAASWLMLDSFQKKDYGAALHFADALLRTRTQALPNVLPIMGRIAETPEAGDALAKLLAGNPPWRRAFLSALPTAVADARTPLTLLLALKETSSPPTLADAREYVGLLVQHKLYELAYYTWLQFLPPEQVGGAGFLFNGSFEHAPSGLPFDWQLTGGTGATVEIAWRPDALGQRALFIELGPGRVEFGGVAQTLMLGPGGYQLKGKFQGEVVGPRGLAWRMTCAGGGPSLGQSAMMIGSAPQWKDVALSFTVPKAECRAQELRLVLDARTPSEHLVSGSSWHDELQIVRTE